MKTAQMVARLLWGAASQISFMGLGIYIIWSNRVDMKDLALLISMGLVATGVEIVTAIRSIQQTNIYIDSKHRYPPKPEDV